MNYQSINNRRYLGNKYKLLPFIKKVVDENCQVVQVFADLFAGTGAVSSAFVDRRLITNDILYSNYISNLAWFGAAKYDTAKIEKCVSAYNSLVSNEENYMTENFADTFFSRAVCSKIGWIRQDIESKYENGVLNDRERAILITSLLYAMDRIANTCGHYDAYRKGAELAGDIRLSCLAASNANNDGNLCFNQDINELAPSIYADLVYLDPPYNSRQYCDAYHLLENVAKWQCKPVKGVARKMDRSGLKSDYCTNKATAAFKDLINKINAGYILLSYNNMNAKGNPRSNAKITDEDIMEILRARGEVSVFSQKHKLFSAGKSDIDDNEERLFLCVCRD